MARLATILAAIFCALAVSQAYAAITASFECSPSCDVPVGTTVTFTSTSTSDTPFREFAWDLDGDGLYGSEDDPNEPQGADQTAQRTFNAPGTYTVGLRASNNAAESDDATRTITVTGEAPPPPANQPPIAVLDRKCEGDEAFLQVCPGQVAKEGKAFVISAAPSSDPDGSIVKYEWDFDGDGAYEQTTFLPLASHTYPTAGGAGVSLRVTDDDGATGTAAAVVVVKAKCRSEVVFKRMRATSPCFKRTLKGGKFGKSAIFSSKDPISLNGISIVPKGGKAIRITGLVDKDGDLMNAVIKSANARATTKFEGKKVVLKDGKLTWAVSASGKELKGPKLKKLNGLKVTKLTGPVTLSADKKSSRIEFYLALPQGMGGGTSKKPVALTPGKPTSAANGFSFEVATGSIGPIGLEKMKVFYDGDGFWGIDGKVAMPPPIPYSIEAGLGVDNGAFSYGQAAVDGLNVGPFGPGIFLQRIKFRIEVKPNPSKPATAQCTPKVGIEFINVDEIFAHKFGFHLHDPKGFNIDHGVPNFALCGEIELTAGPKILGASAISLDAGLGFATFPDRPAIFRAFGKVSIVEIPIAHARFQAHANGYTKMNAEFGAGIDDIAHIEGFIKFEMYLPKFNAEAFIEACVDLIDLCAGARGLISSKGVAICLRLPLDWHPGIAYEWGESLDVYWSGCSVGPYKEQINASAAGGRRVKAAGGEQLLDIKPGLPGAAVTLAGQGAPPKVTLHGPNGEQFTTPAGMEAVKDERYWLIKDPRSNTTSIALIKPAPGRWRVAVDADSVPVTSIQQADGLEKPDVRAKVGGRGYRRFISYRLRPRKGQRVTFVEDGPSAGRMIGVAKGARGRIRFRPADGKAERRPIFAVVEQDGFVRDRIKVAAYRAPGPFRPAKPRRLRIKRQGRALLVRWGRSPGARRYEIKAKLSDGRRLFFLTRRIRLRIGGVRGSLRGTISVRGISAAGMKGRAAKATHTGRRRVKSR